MPPRRGRGGDETMMLGETSSHGKSSADLLNALSFTPSNKSAYSSDADSDPPLHHIISFLALSSPTEKGVSIPPLLQALFGIDFLPRHDGSSETAPDDVESIQSELSLEEEEEVATPTGDLTADDIQASFELKTRRKTAVGKLASRVVAQAREKRRRRRLRKDTVESFDDSTLTESLVSRSRKASKNNVTWVQKQQAKLEQHKANLDAVQKETLAVEARAKSLSTHLSQVQQQVSELEQALSQSMAELQKDTRELQQTKKELKRLEDKRNRATRAVQETASAIRRGRGMPPLPRRPLDDDPVLNPLMATPIVSNLDDGRSMDAPPRQRADSAPTDLRSAPAATLRRAESSSFIRVHDLDLATPTENSSLSSGSSAAARDMFFLDDDVTTVLTALSKFGYDLATDESDRFVPALNTEKLMSQNTTPPVDPSWPIQPWHAPSGKDIFVWTGSVDHSDGHGGNFPVIKARAIIPTAPRNVMDLVLDSSRAAEYNKMSQGRKDVTYVQQGIDTTADESPYDIPGEAKIIKSLNKPPLIRRRIEMLSLIYARRLENDAYLSVNRSVWEDSSGEAQTTEKDVLRSEILLGVNILRPVVVSSNHDVHCEMTTITHAHTSGLVPDALARKMGPAQAVNFLREIQSLFEIV